jgi:3-deoxy-D-manno-octulosonic-acid transferase
MDDFLDARDLLVEAGAGIEVADAQALFDAIFALLQDDEERRQRGRAGRAALERRGRVADRLAAKVAEMLGD